MKLGEFGVGKITKQNATKDAPIGSEYSNVKKLGLGSGKPKIHDKKATKNSDPNTLFNLGIAEANTSSVDEKEIERMIRDSAKQRGIDPDVAVRVWRSEGGTAYQSRIKRDGEGSSGGYEASYGPFQLYTGGGLGNEYQDRYGIDLSKDNTPDGIQRQIDFSLDKAAEKGWKPWYGAANVGIKPYQGIGDKPPHYEPIQEPKKPNNTNNFMQRLYKAQGEKVPPYFQASAAVTNNPFGVKARKVSTVDNPTRSSNNQSFGDAFAAARKRAGGAGGKFTWQGKEYQTNVKGEKYVSNPTSVDESEVQELKIEKPDSKDTLGVKRKDMPQVKSDDYAEFIAYLKKNGATFTKETIPARELKAMQKEFSDEGILKQMMKNIEQGPNRKAVIASSDDYILDGHHRWLVAVNTGDDLNVYRVNMPAWELYDLVNKFEKTYYKDIYERGSIGVPLASGLVMKLFPHRPLKIAKSTPGKLRYDEAVTQVDIDQLERFADKMFAKVGIDVEFGRHFMDRVNDARNKKPITPAELTRLFKQEFKRWGKPIAQMGPDQEGVMKDMQTDINIPFMLQWDAENNELDLIAKTVMRKKDFKTPDREFAVEVSQSQDSLGSQINFPGFEKNKEKPKPKYNPVPKQDKSILDKVKGWFTDDINEAYVLRLENDDDMLVLHIRDTKSGERVEVRGKPNYEIDYDADDELHQLLDVIGKASNISDLMNGKIVNINPKHPDGPKSYAAIEKVMGEEWSAKYKRSINCDNPRGFSQKAHCAGRKKNEGAEITMWTNPEYQGSDVDDEYYNKQPAKIIDINKLTPFEPADKMDDPISATNMGKLVKAIQAGEKINPIIVVPYEGKLLIIDGHHRYFAHIKAGADKIPVVMADPKNLTWRDDVPEEELAEAFNKETGKEMFAYFQKMHTHEPDNNTEMKQFMLSHDWELRDFTPDMFPSEEEFFDYDDPFNRVIDVDYSRRVDLSQPIIVGPQYADGKYSVIDGNHRAAAAQRMGKTIKGYFPVNQVVDEAPTARDSMNLDADKLQQSIDYFYTTHAPKNFGSARTEGNFKGLKVVTFTKGGDTLMFLVDNTDQAVFYVMYSKFDDGVAIGNVRSNGTVKATEVYAYLVDKFGTLYSDDSQTPQGSKIWTSLAKFYPNLDVKDTGGRFVATKKTQVEEGVNDKVYELLLDNIGAGPFDGGCVVVAQALQLIHGGELMALVRNDGTADHAVVQKGNTMYDFDGPGTPEEVVSRFEKNEGTRIAEVRKLRMTDLLDAPRNSKLAKQIASLMKESVQEAKVEEGVNDPHIFKAVFLAGGPGSGKSFVANNILGGTGLRSVNSDEVYEFLMKKQGLSLDPETIFSPQGQEIRDKAKGISRKREATYLDGRLGLIIDGTGKDVSKYETMAQKLRAIGYDTSMIYVNTSLEVAQQRNKQRERSLEPAKVEKMWNEVQQNLMQFQQIFGAGRFHIIDNSGGLEDLDRQKNFDKVYNETQRFLNTPPKNRKALAWIQKQKEQNDGQRSAQQPTNQEPDGGTTATN